MKRGPRGRARTGPRRGKRSVREDHRQPDQHVLDASVAARLLAGGSRRDEPPHGGSGQRARIVPERQTARVELLLESESVDPGLAATDEVGFVNVEDAVERAHVHHHLAGGRRQRTAHPAACAHRRHRYVVGGRPAEHAGDLITSRRAHDQDLRRSLAGAFIHDRERPQVADRPFVDCGRAHDLLELSSHPSSDSGPLDTHSCLAANRPASQPVRMGTPNPQGPLYS